MIVQRVMREYYQRSLFDFAKFQLGYKDITKRTHGKIVDALEESTSKKLICVPRGCFKSTITSISYPLWLLIRNPNLRIMIDSEIYTNSKNFLREIRGHIESEDFKAVFGDLVGPLWQEGDIILKSRTRVLKEPSISCAGVETTKVGMHFDVIIFDDLCSDNNMNTEESREKVIRHYQMATAILEPGGVMVVVGTRYHDMDVIGHIVKQELDPEVVKVYGIK